MRDLRDPVVALSVITLTALLAVTGPFGSYLTMSFGERLAFWVPVNLVGSVIGLLIGVLVENSGIRLNERKFALLSATVSAIVMAAPLYELIDQTLVPFVSAFWGLLEAALLIFFSNLGICSLRKAWQIEVPNQPADMVELETAYAGRPAFVALLPNEVQGKVELISGRDHYIDIETDRGKASLLMRFSDAVQQLDADVGLQVHRSYWVGFERMRSVQKDGQRHFLILNGGHRVPVSKSQLETLQARLASSRMDQFA